MKRANGSDLLPGTVDGSQIWCLNLGSKRPRVMSTYYVAVGFLFCGFGLFRSLVEARDAFSVWLLESLYWLETLRWWGEVIGRKGSAL